MGKYPNRPNKPNKPGGANPNKPSKSSGTSKKKPGKWGPAPSAGCDITVLLIVIILVLFGIMMIFSASYYNTMTSAKFGNDMFYFLKRQCVWAVIGTIGMFTAMMIPYTAWQRVALLAYWVSNILLLMVRFVGIEVNGQKRWLGIGPLQFQPSEFTKIAVIWFLSVYVIRHREELGNWKGFLKACAVLGLPVFLITLSNFSSALLVGLTGVTILFLAAPNLKFFGMLAGIAAPAMVAAVALPGFRYRLGRIRIWTDPWSDPMGDGFQIIQSLYAVASGGMFGLGLGQSRQKSFIPEPHNDIIFAIICEELGIIGAGLIILLFAVLIWRGIRIAIHAKELFGMYVAAGITALIAFQSIINISVVTNTMPNTGQPLPFISYGGTSLVFLMGMMGILLNISMYPRSNE